MKKNAKPKKKMGRPSMGAKARREMLHIRVTATELEMLRGLAEREGISMGDLVMRPWRQQKGD